MDTNTCARCGAAIALQVDEDLSSWVDAEGFSICHDLVAHDGRIPHGLSHTPSWDKAARAELRATRVHRYDEFCPECELSRPLGRLYIAPTRWERTPSGWRRSGAPWRLPWGCSARSPMAIAELG